jgi:hypothetical protein
MRPPYAYTLPENKNILSTKGTSSFQLILSLAPASLSAQARCRCAQARRPNSPRRICRSANSAPLHRGELPVTPQPLLSFVIVHFASALRERPVACRPSDRVTLLDVLARALALRFATAGR